MLFLTSLYSYYNADYTELSLPEKRRVESAVNKLILSACSFQTIHTVYQWKKNGGLIPLCSALEISRSEEFSGISVDASAYPIRKRPKLQPKHAA
jgi:hypothetical protein